MTHVLCQDSICDQICKLSGFSPEFLILYYLYSLKIFLFIIQIGAVRKVRHIYNQLPPNGLSAGDQLRVVGIQTVGSRVHNYKKHAWTFLLHKKCLDIHCTHTCTIQKKISTWCQCKQSLFIHVTMQS